MRILYHHRTMGDGAEGIHIGEMVRAWRAHGHDVLVAALAGDPTRLQPSRASRVSALRRLIPSPLYELAELGYNVVGSRYLQRAIHRFKPDVIYDRYNSYSTAALRAARRAGLPLLIEVNAPVAYERRVYEHLPLRWPALARRYERHILSGADCVFVVSTPLRQHLIDTVGIDPRAIVVLPNGADPDVFAPRGDVDVIRRQYGFGDRLVIGFVGILRPWHGVDLLLEAFSELRANHPSAHLLIVGDGPIRPQLEAQAEALGLRTVVTFTGRLSHEDVGSRVAVMDIAVSPHATFYASPMKLLEYMSMSRAVVAPAMDNIRDIVEDGRSGLLFAPRDARALADSLRRLALDPALRSRLGAAARCRVLQRFNWAYNAQRVVEEATRLLQGPGASPASGGENGR